MSRRRKAKKNGNPPATPAGRKSFATAAAVALTVAGVALLGVWWTGSREAGAPPTAALRTGAAATSPTVVAESKPDFQKLTGQWVRPDGGYVIDVKSVDDSGTMDAAYFNPSPIHVARAEASWDGGAIKVFVELRAVNYPGSTYTLAWEPQSDQLKGRHRAAL